MRFLIIGGSDAGVSAALRARELDTSARITLVLADEFPNYSVCGLPFYVSGETPEWRHLAHRTEFEGIELLPNHLAQAIDPSARTVSVNDAAGGVKTLPYDLLLIATGARPVLPDIPGVSLPGVFPLHTMEHGLRLRRHLDEMQRRSAIIIGSGYIGLEMADALTHRGMEVTLIGRSETVLATVDADHGRMVEAELSAHGVRVESGAEARAISQDGDRLRVESTQATVTADIVIVGVGVQPNAELGAGAGIKRARKVRCA